MKASFQAKTVEEQIEALSHASGEQLPTPSLNARLVRDLSLVYDHSSYAQHLEQSLEHIEQRLQIQFHRQGNALGSAPPHARNGISANRSSAHKREQPQRTLSPSRPFVAVLKSLAALLCVIALVGSLVLLLHTAPRRGKTFNTSSSTTATAVPGKAVSLQTIHMFDTQTGWAVASGNTRILHTTTGMTRWKDVSPIRITTSSIITGTNFFSPLTAWVAVASETGSFLYRTQNGGQSWQKAPIPDQIVGNCQIAFLNTQNGWLLVGKGAATGSEAVDVLQSNDGGASWQIISATRYTGNRPTALPFGGEKSGISFVNATTGWVTGSSATNKGVWLYVTHDGGASWQPQSIPLGDNTDNNQAATIPPVFFNATQGILPVVFAGFTHQTIIYSTQDGGEHWNATTALPLMALAQTTAFVDATHGWVADNTDDARSDQYLHSTVYRTSDGGQHWNASTVTFDADLALLDFTSSTQGWAIDAAQRLYQTTDGGQTWTKMTPTVE